jgi:hypothetical protein
MPSIPMENLENQTTKPPAFDDIIERYRVLYGSEWANGGVEDMITRLQKACEAKELGFLLSWLLPQHNGFSRECFIRITGKHLPKTQQAIRLVLEEFVGKEAVALYQQALADKQKQREQGQQDRARERLLRDVASRKVRYQGETLTVDTFIQRIITEGYIRLEERKRGAVPIYSLWHIDNKRYYDFRRKCEYEYIRYLLHEQQTTQEQGTYDDETDGGKEMKVFDQYVNREPIMIRGEYGRVVAVIPPGTRGCINRVPTKQDPDPCFEVIHEGQWHSLCVKKDILAVQKGNVQVQRLMAICPAIQQCLTHTNHNIRDEVSAEHSALNHFFLQVSALRFLPPTEMKQALGVIRQDTTFQDRIKQQYEKEDTHWRIPYEVSLGHYEYLLRTLDQFLATGILKKQLCWCLHSHQELVRRDQSILCPESAIQLTYRVAREQAAILVAQEKNQVSSYPLLYAAYIIFELIQKDLFQAWYDYRDISYSEQKRIAQEALIAVEYQELVA